MEEIKREGAEIVKEDSGNSFVKKQPTSEKEVELCVEALESCPVDAIGQDGE